MLPLGDDNLEGAPTPWVTYTLIAINVFVFVVLQGMAGPENKFTYAWATTPQEIVTGEDLVTDDGRVIDPNTGQEYKVPGHQPIPVHPWVTLLTAMFMHGSWMHLIFNMLYLWIFGDNLEHIMGKVRYLVFYLLTGLVAGLSHVFVTQWMGSEEAMRIVSLGASGAISGVLGGYMLLFPRNQVLMLLFRVVTRVPSWVALGLWIALQIFSSVMEANAGGAGGGVAYAAHIGGFVAGLALVKLFVKPAENVEVQKRRRWTRHLDEVAGE